jgi:replicative DNA helicase
MTDIDVTTLYSQEAEEAVIGSILITPDQFIGLQGFLRAGDFFLVRHRIIWKSFERLSDKGESIAAYTVGMDLAAIGQIDDVGGPVGLMTFLSLDINSMHAETYARYVQRLATRRAILETSDAMRKDALDEGASVDLVIARTERAALDLRRRQMAVDTPILSMEEAMIAKFDAMNASEERHKENPNYVIGVRTGVPDLDHMLDGLRAGVTTLAGPTGGGKTALCLQMVRFAARFGLLRGLVAQPAKTLFFSGEMTQDQLMNRLLSSMTGVPVRHIERGSYTSAQKQSLIEALHELTQDHCLSFESGKRMNTAQIRQRVRTLVIDHGLDFLALDGLLQIEALSIDAHDSPKQKAYMNDKRRDVIESIMDDLEDITLTYHTPILLTHQLSRAPGGRGDKRPILSDLAEANFVEQKSAVVLFLYREGYYNPESIAPNAAEIICAKNRFGMTGTIDQTFDAAYTRFIEPTEHYMDLKG